MRKERVMIFKFFAVAAMLLIAFTGQAFAEAPDTPVLSSPSHGQVVEGEVVVLEWEAPAGADAYALHVWELTGGVVDVVVDNELVSDTSYTLDVRDDGGVYAWTVAAATSGADVFSDWAVPIAFVNGTDKDILPPSLTSPEHSSNAAGTSVNLQWEAPAGADAYALMVWKYTEEGYVTVINNEPVDETSYLLEGLDDEGDQYAWTVVAGDSATGEYGDYAFPWVFVNGEEDVEEELEVVSVEAIIDGDDLKISGEVKGEVDEVSLGALRNVDEQEYDDDVPGHQAFMQPVEDGEFEVVLTEGESWPGGDEWHGLRTGTHQIRAAILDDQEEIVHFLDSNEFVVVTTEEEALDHLKANTELELTSEGNEITAVVTYPNFISDKLEDYTVDALVEVLTGGVLEDGTIIEIYYNESKVGVVSLDDSWDGWDSKAVYLSKLINQADPDGNVFRPAAAAYPDGRTNILGHEGRTDTWKLTIEPANRTLLDIQVTSQVSDNWADPVDIASDQTRVDFDVPQTVRVVDADTLERALENAEVNNIILADGEYEGLFTVQHSQTLVAENEHQAVIKNPQDVQGGTPIIEATADNVSFEDLTINVVPADAVASGIHLSGDNGEIFNCRLINDTAVGGQTFFAGNGDSSVISGNELINAIVTDWGSGEVKIENNIFSGEVVDEGIWTSGNYSELTIKGNDLTELTTGVNDVKIVNKPDSVNEGISPHAMIMAILQDNEGVASVYLDWMDQAGTKTETLEYTIYNSGRSAYNKALDRPYVEYTVDGHQITLDFVNPTPHAFVFDYRIDGETGTEHDWSDELINEGELEGEYIGEWYNPFTLIEDSSSETLSGNEQVWVGMRVGAEQNWYLGWIIFERK